MAMNMCSSTYHPAQTNTHLYLETHIVYKPRAFTNKRKRLFMWHLRELPNKIQFLYLQRKEHRSRWLFSTIHPVITVIYVFFFVVAFTAVSHPLNVFVGIHKSIRIMTESRCSWSVARSHIDVTWKIIGTILFEKKKKKMKKMKK